MSRIITNAKQATVLIALIGFIHCVPTKNVVITEIEGTANSMKYLLSSKGDKIDMHQYPYLQLELAKFDTISVTVYEVAPSLYRLETPHLEKYSLYFDDSLGRYYHFVACGIELTEEYCSVDVYNNALFNEIEWDFLSVLSNYNQIKWFEIENGNLVSTKIMLNLDERLLDNSKDSCETVKVPETIFIQPTMELSLTEFRSALNLIDSLETKYHKCFQKKYNINLSHLFDAMNLK